MIKYFISYTFWDGGDKHGAGHFAINRDEPIRDIEDIKAIVAQLEDHEKVIVVNWKRFEE